MKVRINAATPNSIEIDGVVFNEPKAVEHFIKALRVAKDVVWMPPKKFAPEKKK